MGSVVGWFGASRRRVTVGGWVACGLLAALFLSPAIRKGGLGPGDLLLSMTPWQLYHDRFPQIHGVANPQLDVIQQYFPWRMFAARELKQGVIPLWNPAEYCGQPFVANVLSAVFYPFTWLALWLPIGRFFLLSAWLHLTLLGGGMWLLLRAHGLRWQAALGGAGVMMFNSFVIGWLEYANLSQWTYAWLPLTCYLWRRAYLARRPGQVVQPALTLALAALGGHVQIALYVATAWVVYAGLTVLGGSGEHAAPARDPGAAPESRAGRVGDLCRYLLLPGLLAGGLAAIQILPAYELAQLSGRVGQPYAALASAKFPWSRLIVLLSPWFYGSNALQLDGRGPLFWGGGPNAIEWSVSTGTAAVLLAAVAVCCRRERALWPFVVIALLGPLLALRTPLYWLFWKFVPGFSSLRGLERAFSLWCFGVAALSGFGLDLLWRSAPAKEVRQRLVVALLGGVGLAFVAAWVGEALRTEGPQSLTALHPALTGYVAGQTGLALLAAGAMAAAVGWGWPRGRTTWVAAVATLELVWVGWGQHPGVPSEAFFFNTPETEFLASRAEPYRLLGVPGGGRPAFLDWMPMNTPMAYGLASPTGSESLSYEGYRKLLELFCPLGWEAKLESPLVDLVGVRYVLSRGDLEGVAGLRRVAGSRCGIYENPEALSLGFASSRLSRLGASATMAALAQPDFDPRRVLLPPDYPGSDQPLTSGEFAPLYTKGPTPQRWLVTGEVPDGGVVVLTSVGGPGWQAMVGARRVRIYRADGAFQAVASEPGRQIVRWWYEPTSYRLGAFLTLLALAAAAALRVGRGCML